MDNEQRSAELTTVDIRRQVAQFAEEMNEERTLNEFRQ